VQTLSIWEYDHGPKTVAQIDTWRTWQADGFYQNPIRDRLGLLSFSLMLQLLCAIHR
jgi:hypothetical protein